MTLLEQAKRVLQIEAEAVASLIGRLDDRFIQAVELLYACKGRVVLTGMGKSGFVAKKIAATFASTGTPALFLHPAEGVHGDLGMVVRGDVVVAVSNSGETPELLELLPYIKRFGVKLISLVGDPTSTLAKESDVFLDVSVREEACPMNLAPTASTTAALAMGDALAVALLEKRGCQPENFALLHPGGRLGRKLLKVADLMHGGEEVPRIVQEASMKEAILEMTGKRLGMTTIVDQGGKLVGIITDGDLRRALQKVGDDLLRRRASEFMTRNPKKIEKEELGAKAVEIMERYAMTSLIIVDQEGSPEGVIHLHDLLTAGVV